MSRERLLVSVVALFSPAVSHVRGQAVHAGDLEQPPNGPSAEMDVVVAEQVHADPGRAEVIGLPQVQDLLHHVPGGGPGRCVRSGRSVLQAFRAELLVPAMPAVVAGSADPVVPARLGHIAGNLLDVAKPGEAGLGTSIIGTHMATQDSRTRRPVGARSWSKV